MARGHWGVLAVVFWSAFAGLTPNLLPVFVPAALAADECGTGTSVTCTPSGNPYAGGISYSGTNQSVTIQGGVVVNSVNGVTLSGSGTQTVTVTGSGVSISASGHTALDIEGATGAITVDAGSASFAAGGSGSNGVEGYSPTSSVSITTGDVTLDGTAYDGFGVIGLSYGDFVSIDTSAGTVSTQADGGLGIYGVSYASSVTITTAGITASGNNISGGDAVYGVYALGVGAMTVDTSAGAVTLTGTTTSDGLYVVNAAGSGGGPVSVTTANVSTKAANAYAIDAESNNGTGANGAVTVDSTAGVIHTDGAGAVGIYAANNASANGGLVTVHAGDVTTTGTGAAYGIRANSKSGAVTVTAGDISTAGNGAYGVYATGTGTMNVTTGDVTTLGTATYGILATTAGDLTVDSTAGKITTSGKGSRAVTIDKLSGATTVHAGAIETSGDNATGIHIYEGTLQGDGTGGAVTVTAHSIVVTGNTATGNSGHYEVGNEADGIDIFNVGSGDNGKITIDTSVGATPDTLGVVSVSGYKSRGIVATSGRLIGTTPTGGGPINITTGTVTATGDFGTAVDAESYGTGADGAITIKALGTVSASGANLFNLTPPENEGNYQPDGIYAVSWGGGDVTITTKDVSSTGEAANAIFAQSGNSGTAYVGLGKVTVDTTGGTISAKGDGSDGIGVGSASGVVSITTGDVKTQGNQGIGVAASNTGPNSAMTIDTTGGKITTTGQGSHGIDAVTGNSLFSTSNAGLLKILAGDIDVEGPGASAIYAGAYNGPIDIEVSGDLKTGTSGGTGIIVKPAGTTATTINVAATGSITTSATSAHGIYVMSGGGTTTNSITIEGLVKATGTSAYGMLVAADAGDTITIHGTGEVDGTLAAIRLEQSGSVTVTNAGTLKGTGGTAVQFLGGYGSTFDNDGAVTGDVLFSGGDDTAILRSNSVIAGNIDGKGGTDKLKLAGTGSASLDTTTILNFESAEKDDTGHWTLTGADAFVPTFAVNAGLLSVNGTLTSTAFSVASGATIGGSGSLGALTVASGGKVAPGNSIGTLTAASAEFDANTTFEVEVDPANADKLIVNGVASIDPAAQVSVLAATGSYVDGTSYLILDASGGSLSGAFSDTVVDNSAFLSFALDQTTYPNQVWLTVSVVATLPDVAETPNQLAAAGGIQEQGPGSDLFDAIVPLDADSARHAFDLSSGEIHATVKGAMLADARLPREAVLARFDADWLDGASGGGGADAATRAPGPQWAGWVQGFGNSVRGDGDGNAAGYSGSLGGFLAGVDVAEQGAWRIGAAVGYSGSSLDIPDRASAATIDAYHAAAYGGLEAGAWSLRIGGAVASATVATVRGDTFSGFSQTLTARYGATIGQVFGEAAYRMHIGGLGIEPFADIATVHVATDAFNESGGSAALSADAQSQSVTFTSLGARVATLLPFGGSSLRLSASAAWQHTLGTTTPTASLAFSGGTPFTVAGPPLARDALKLQADADWKIGTGMTVGVGYSGVIASGANDHAVTGRFTLRF